MHQGSAVTSMDFHPSHLTVLLGMKALYIYLLFSAVYPMEPNETESTNPNPSPSTQTHKNNRKEKNPCIGICFIMNKFLTRSCFAVGCSSGEISLWELGSREKMVSKPFKVWDVASCSLPFQVVCYIWIVLNIFSIFIVKLLSSKVIVIHRSCTFSYMNFMPSWWCIHSRCFFWCSHKWSKK